MVERPFFLDMTYELMVGEPPSDQMSRREVSSAIVKHWKKSRIVTHQEAVCARLTLSCIGLDWHSAAKLPYTFEEVASRLRPLLAPEDAARDIREMMVKLYRHRR